MQCDSIRRANLIRIRHNRARHKEGRIFTISNSGATMNHFPLLFLGDDECAISNIRTFRFPKFAFRSRNSKCGKSPESRYFFPGKKKKERGENDALLNYSLSRGGELKGHRLCIECALERRSKRIPC
ncbi:hypothetical protein CEXT_289811 [Caerostris extrusa]|uniref:Uncharacterized protein n=1 Tax=Caerostris extrusa TaxID=172846 RepID=A0AAV4N810_CAEEX|nr:hypothetical protein CEXT_289811 [Caerostris extrusa]